MACQDLIIRRSSLPNPGPRYIIKKLWHALEEDHKNVIARFLMIIIDGKEEETIGKWEEKDAFQSRPLPRPSAILDVPKATSLSLNRDHSTMVKLGHASEADRKNFIDHLSMTIVDGIEEEIMGKWENDEAFQSILPKQSTLWHCKAKRYFIQIQELENLDVPSATFPLRPFSLDETTTSQKLCGSS